MNIPDIQTAASRWVDDHGECLYRYALVSVRKPEVAEDLRETSSTDMEFLSDEYSEKFVPIGFWDHEKGPLEWKPEPDEVIHRTEFWQVMRDCLTKLPQKVRDVFTMREMGDVPSKEICAILSITDSNLWVMLHRARMALRECLEMNWFDKPAGGRA